MSDKLTALVPAHNDDYTLDLCLHSLVDHFDEVLVLDDCSTDHTSDIALDMSSRHRHVRVLRHEGRQLGWIEARNRLLEATDSELLFWLDADDVLCEYNAPMLREIASGPTPIVRLHLTEMWGDFYHTTGRWHHHDRCHVFVNRRLMRDFRWGGGSAAKLVAEGGFSAGQSRGPLFFHVKGVKPDRRLVERQFVRRWFRAGRPTPTVAEFAKLDEMDPKEIHARAVEMLLHSRQDRLVPTYAGENAPDGAPRRPEVIVEAPRRFLVIYRHKKPYDRIEGAWQPLSWSPNDG